MSSIDHRCDVSKVAGPEELAGGSGGAIRQYQKFFVGRTGLFSLLRYEIATTLAAPFPGAFGYLLRKWTMPGLMGRVGRGVKWGRNIGLRHPCKMSIGDGTAIDDGCLLDARGAGEGGFRIGERVIVGRNCQIQSKTDAGFIDIGDDCSIGGQSTLSSAGGIRLGRSVLIAGHCYIGGGRYHDRLLDVPMREQGLYSLGPVVIGDDCWIGAGACILDGVAIGRGAVVGAGSVVTKAVPDYAVVVGIPARVVRMRDAHRDDAEAAGLPTTHLLENAGRRPLDGA